MERDAAAAKKAASHKFTHELAAENDNLVHIPHPTLAVYLNPEAYDISQAYLRDDGDNGASLFVDQLETPSNPYPDHLLWLGFDKREDAQKAFAVLKGEKQPSPAICPRPPAHRNF
jgi:hypothetical protein